MTYLLCVRHQGRRDPSQHGEAAGRVYDPDELESASRHSELFSVRFYIPFSSLDGACGRGLDMRHEKKEIAVGFD